MSALGNSLTDYAPVLVQVLIAFGLGVAVLLVSHVFGQRLSRSSIKDTPYECGLVGDGRGHARFSVKFYVTAMLFILFDIEIVFLFPWVMVYRDFLQAGIPILMPILFFILVLVVGLIYEVKKGALEWEK